MWKKQKVLCGRFLVVGSKGTILFSQMSGPFIEDDVLFVTHIVPEIWNFQSEWSTITGGEWWWFKFNPGAICRDSDSYFFLNYLIKIGWRGCLMKKVFQGFQTKGFFSQVFQTKCH